MKTLLLSASDVRRLLDREALSREPADDAVREEREAFVAHLMQNLTGVQQAKGTR